MEKNEFELINYIKSIVDKKYNKFYDSQSGIGDDCAFIEHIRQDESITITTDALVENVHFDLSYYSMYDVGYKSAIVNISDIIAKGASPTLMFISLAIPKKITDSDIENFYNGFTDAIFPYNALIAGGDTTSSKDSFFISITALGTVSKNIKILRGGAKEDDNIYVLGRLGESAIGLDILQGNTIIKNQKCTEAHLRPQLFYSQFQEIIKRYSINSSLDISDGLLQDLSHIAKASNVVCNVIDYANFDLVNDVYKNFITTSYDSGNREKILKYILSGGEDYAIAFTSPDTIEETENLIRIGSIGKTHNGEKPSVVLYDKNNNTIEMTNMGYMHF